MLLRLMLVLACGVLLNAQDSAVKVTEEMRTFPTYDEGAPNPNPQFGAFYAKPFPNYPYTIRTPINKNRSLLPWRVVVLENEYLSCRVLPDLGGHLHGCSDRITGKEIFYANPAVRRTFESQRGNFITTGIESSFPMAHNRMTGSPVAYAWSVKDGVGRVVVENTDLATGMQWRVEFLLRPGSAVLEQRGTVYNGSAARRGYQWWVNAAVELDDPHLRILYPTRWMIDMGAATPWPVNASGLDLSDFQNNEAQTGWFAHLSHEPWMALYKPKFRSGVAHYADANRVRGKKIWLWGRTNTYVQENLTENFNAEVEMQAGELETQYDFDFLQPSESKIFVHYWIPFHDLGGVSRATPDAVLNLSRQGPSVVVELNPTRVMKGATLRLADGGTTVWEGAVDLDPRVKYARTVEARNLTVDLKNASGKVLLHHVEGECNAEAYDAAAKYPLPPSGDSDEEEASLERGRYREQRDELVLAWSDYERGLKRTPGSAELALAAGRTAVALNRYEDAARLLKGLANTSAEAAYYYGVALAEGSPQVEEAQTALVLAAKDQAYAPAARLQLARLAAREQGAAGLAEAVRAVQALAGKSGAAPGVGGLEVALLRRSGKVSEANQRLKFWLAVDPANDLLRVEQTWGGVDDPALWRQWGADPERVLNVAELYMNIGAYDDAVKLLERNYPAPADTEKEPGAALPQENPLVAYFRGYCRQKMGQDARGDFSQASSLPALYVFPHRAVEFKILAAALGQNEADGLAHALLGDLYFDSYRPMEAIAEWKKALALKPELPALHRNLGRALWEFAHDPVAAAPLLLEGQRLTPQDGEFEWALSQIKVPTLAAAAAAPATKAAPAADPAVDPAAATRTLSADAGGTGAGTVAMAKGNIAETALLRSVKDAEWAARQFNATAFPKERQPDDVRRDYLEVQLQRVLAQARGGHCPEALAGLDTLGQVDEALPFTFSKFSGFIKQAHFQYYLGVVESTCGEVKAAQRRWGRVSKSSEPANSTDSVFVYLAAKRLGEGDAGVRIEAALAEAKKTAPEAQRSFVQGGLLVAAGKVEEGNALLEKAAESGEPLLQYMSLSLLAEVARKRP